MGFKDHFSSRADEYAAFRPRYPDALFHYLAGSAPSLGFAWDCACGNGQAALALAEHFDRIVATDASAEQIACAAEHERIEYRVAPAEESSLDSGSIDLVCVAQAMHWFDLDRFHLEVKRVAAPGAVLAAWCYELFEIDPEIDERIFAFYDGAIGPYWPPERRHIEAGYGDIEFPYRETVAPEFQMTASWNLPETIGYLGTWSALTRYRSSNDDDPLAELGRDLEALWGDPARRRMARWLLKLRIGIVDG